MSASRLVVFTKRFRELLGKRTPTEFSNEYGLKRQTVGLFYSGERIPGAPMLREICEKTGVSADWLLDLSDVRSVDADKKAVCDYTGLSETAITNLINEVRDPRSRHLWNLLLGVLDADKLHRFSLAADRLVSYYENRAQIHFKSKTLLEHIPEDKREEFQSYIQQWGGELIDPEEAAMVFAHEVEDALGKLLFFAGHKLPPSGTEENEISQLL